MKNANFIEVAHEILVKIFSIVLQDLVLPSFEEVLIAV